MQQRSFISVMAPSEPVLEKPVPTPDTYEIIRNEFPGSVAKFPPIDYPAEPGLHVSVGWSSYITTDENGNTGVIRVRWGRNDGTLHGKKDYIPLKLFEPGKQMEAQAGIDYIPGTSEGDVVVTVTEIDTYGNTVRISDRIEVPEGAQWAQLAAFYPAVMPSPEVNAHYQWTIDARSHGTLADPSIVAPYFVNNPNRRPAWDRTVPGTIITGSEVLSGNRPIVPFDKLRFRWAIPDLNVESFVDYDPPTAPPPPSGFSGGVSSRTEASVALRFISTYGEQYMCWLYEYYVLNSSNTAIAHFEWHADEGVWHQLNNGPPGPGDRFYSAAVAPAGALRRDYPGWIALVEHINT